MLHKYWLKLRYMNIWNLTQLITGILTITLSGFVAYYVLFHVIEQYATSVLAEDFGSVKMHMKEAGDNLLKAADEIARLVESGEFTKERVDQLSTFKHNNQKFDVIIIADMENSLLYCENSCGFSPKEFHIPILSVALNNARVVSTERLPAKFLKSQGLENKALVTTTDGSGKVIKDALAHLAAVPYYKNGKQAGVVIVGFLMNNNSSLPDWYKQNLGGGLSVFLDGYRITTNIIDDNDDSLLGQPILSKVINNLNEDHQLYVGKVSLGNRSFARYEFLYNAVNKPIGVIGIAQDYFGFITLFSNVAVFAWLAAIALAFIIFMGLRQLNKVIMQPIRDVTDGVLQMAKNDFDFRVPIEHKVNCWEMLNCNQPKCSIYGTSEVGCWLMTDVLCFDENMPTKERIKRCKECPVFLTYARNESILLSAAFNYSAETVQDLIKELGDYESVILTLAQTIESKDSYTRGHSERVTSYAVALAKKVKLSKKEIEKLRIGAILHDIGKIGVPEDILRKPGSLTKEEFEFIKKHPVIGEEICKNLKFAKDSLAVILHHHERYDGTGYPAGLRGVKIPLEVRITTIADSFDAMTSDRPYRPGMSKEKAIEEFNKNSGKQFDPFLVKQFIELLETNEVNVNKENLAN